MHRVGLLVLVVAGALCSNPETPPPDPPTTTTTTTTSTSVPRRCDQNQAGIVALMCEIEKDLSAIPGVRNIEIASLSTGELQVDVTSFLASREEQEAVSFRVVSALGQYFAEPKTGSILYEALQSIEPQLRITTGPRGSEVQFVTVTGSALLDSVTQGDVDFSEWLEAVSVSQFVPSD